MGMKPLAGLNPFNALAIKNLSKYHSLETIINKMLRHLLFIAIQIIDYQKNIAVQYSSMNHYYRLLNF